MRPQSRSGSSLTWTKPGPLGRWTKPPSTLGAIDAGHDELLAPVAEPGDQADAAPAGQVQDGELLGQAYRVMERDEDGRDIDPDALRPPRDRGGERERRGEVAVIYTVVLGEDDEVE